MCESVKIGRRDLLFAAGGAVLPLAAPTLCRADEPANGDDRPDVPLCDRLCIDYVLPPERAAEGLSAAVREDRENDVLKAFHGTRAVGKPAPVGGPSRAAIFYAKKWAQGRTVTIKFMGGLNPVRTKVREHAEKWLEHVNIKFRFVASGPAEVRIAFNSGAGSWSYMGTDNLTIPADRPTMNFGWLKPDSDTDTYSSVVLHEFGHMLGMIHEHQSPAGGIQWNRQRVIDDCWRTQGWDAAQVQQQIFNRYTVAETQFTKLDRTSIMMYPFPKYWTTDGTGTPWNTKLSEMDIDFMRRQYPKA